MGKGHVKHGHARNGAKSREYSVWSDMINRCYNPNIKIYKHYGGRGITVCDRWLESFQNFLKDMGPRPNNKMVIDRYPNMNGNYEPGNCRWATRVESGRNTRRNRFLTAFGETKTIIEWSKDDRCKVNYVTLNSRINQSKWNHEQAISTPPTPNNDREYKRSRSFVAFG